jgi:hypothetical protein
MSSVRRNQCEACPWKRSTVPDRDIPNGYSRARHRRLLSTVATPGALPRDGVLRVMACHESPVGQEQPCVGWVLHQLGDGNNIGLRLLARDGRFAGLRVDGPQHACLEDTLPKARRRRG